jgi:hypothetical protein
MASHEEPLMSTHVNVVSENVAVKRLKNDVYRVCTRPVTLIINSLHSF